MSDKILTRLEYSELAFELLRQYMPSAIAAKQSIEWRDLSGQVHKDKISLVPCILPDDPDKRAVIVALATYYRPGEIVPLKQLGPLCGKENAVNNGCFQRKLRELEDEGWILICRGEGYQLQPGRLPVQ